MLFLHHSSPQGALSQPRDLGPGGGGGPVGGRGSQGNQLDCPGHDGLWHRSWGDRPAGAAPRCLGEGAGDRVDPPPIRLPGRSDGGLVGLDGAVSQDGPLPGRADPTLFRRGARTDGEKNCRGSPGSHPAHSLEDPPRLPENLPHGGISRGDRRRVSGAFRVPGSRPVRPCRGVCLFSRTRHGGGTVCPSVGRPDQGEEETRVASTTEANIPSSVETLGGEGSPGPGGRVSSGNRTPAGGQTADPGAGAGRNGAHHPGNGLSRGIGHGQDHGRPRL